MSVCVISRYLSCVTLHAGFSAGLVWNLWYCMLYIICVMSALFAFAFGWSVVTLLRPTVLLLPITVCLFTHLCSPAPDSS